MTLIETLRAQVVAQCVGRFGRHWPKRRHELLKAFGEPPIVSPRGVLAMGNHLSDAFRLPVHRGIRDHAAVSQAGAIWADLVIYYLNVCLAGTDAIAMSKARVPRCVKSALRVTYKTNPAATLESDIDAMVIYAPGSSAVPPSKHSENAATREFGEFACDNFGQLSVALFQTKTTWNDTAQTPMLWNMIYNFAAQGKMPRNGFAVGSGSWHLSALSAFAYAFVTVPTQTNLATFKPTSTPVARVAGCTGGAYWGRPTANGVIQSITEFFVNFYNHSSGHFPAPKDVGTGFSSELNATTRTGRIDVNAFDIAP